MSTSQAYFAMAEEERDKERVERRDPPQMTGDVWEDIRKFQEYHGFDSFKPTLKFLASQLGFLKEELNETVDGAKKMRAEEVIDGLVDLIVVAVGTLRFFGDTGKEAWIKVMEANCLKEVGFNQRRPDSGGCDLIKPQGWKKPDLTEEAAWLDGFMQSMSGDEFYSMLKILRGRGVVQVLEECIEIVKSKSDDYASGFSSVVSADYYPNGIDDFVYMIDVLKRHRQTSIIDKARAGLPPNNESLEDTLKDRLIYIALCLEWLRGMTPGQTPNRDMFNKEINYAS